MRKKLTTKTIDALPPAKDKRYEVRDALVVGLHIRVSATGGKVWYLATCVDGRLRRIKLGIYPVISLSGARQRAQGILRDIALGKYAGSVPGSPEAPTPTLGDIIPQFIDRHAKRHTKDWKGTQSVLLRMKKLHGKPIDQIKRADVVRELEAMIADIEETGGKGTRANRGLAAIKKLYSWCIDQGIVEISPVAALKPLIKEVARDRWLTDGEIKSFWRGCEAEGYVVRMKGKDGKRFYQITPWRDGDGNINWLIEDFAQPRPLYGLAELGQAEDDEPVLVVEGEKAADAAQSLFPSHIVITWHGGARAVRHSDWLPLHGFDVTIWPDADEPGLAAAEDIARTLRSVGAASVKIVELPDILPKGWDLADEVPDGVDIKALVRDAKPSEENLTNFLISAKKLAVMDIPPREMIVEPLIAMNSVNLMYASRGIGKTWVGLSLAKAVALGKDFLAYHVPQARPALFIDGEMPLADLKERVKAIGASDIENLDILSSEVMHRDFHALNISREEDQLLISAMLDRLAEQDRNPALIIMDNLSSLRRGVEENDNSALDDILLWLLSLRHKGYATLLVHHAGKLGDQRGASRLEDPVDTTIKLTPGTAPKGDGASLNLEFTKTRGVKPQPGYLKLDLVEGEDGVLEWDFGQAQKVTPQDRTLRAIYNGPEGDGSELFEKQKDLVDVLGVRPGTISKHLAFLRRDELVEKGSLTVTDAGKERLADLFPGETFE